MDGVVGVGVEVFLAVVARVVVAVVVAVVARVVDMARVVVVASVVVGRGTLAEVDSRYAITGTITGNYSVVRPPRFMQNIQSDRNWPRLNRYVPVKLRRVKTLKLRPDYRF